MKTPLTANQSPLQTNNDLHHALIEWYSQSGDRFEVPVDNYIIDIVRGKLLIEVQTKNFSALKSKLTKLTVHHNVLLVYPIPYQKWIIRLAEDGLTQLSRRKSPKTGRFEDVFDELVTFPELLRKSHFSLELLLVQEEELRHYESNRSWRRHGWVIDKRHLLKVVDRRLLETPGDMRAFLPAELVEPFTTLTLSDRLNISRRLAQKMVYCLRRAGCIEITGKRGNAVLYRNKSR